MLWMHGRTAYKELDPGRYMRWMRAGIAFLAIDLPGHGERLIPEAHTPARTLSVLRQATAEVDAVVEELRSPRWAGWFDATRIGIGGMSLGGMATLRRLCQKHSFVCAAVEATTGWLEALYFPESVGLRPRLEPSGHEQADVLELDPWQSLEDFPPLPLLALHSRADRMVPVEGMERFIERLGARYLARGAARSLIEWHTWEETGAPEEHIGFGRFSAEAKDLQTRFLASTLGAG
jgi:alpha-beta hydrolase superfamily lysophospholipase